MQEPPSLRPVNKISTPDKLVPATSTSQSRTIISSTPPKLKKPRRLFIFSMRALLLILFVLGFSLSVLPRGRSSLRSAFILPALVSASQSAPMLAVEEPIQHTQSVITSQSGPVYLDTYSPTEPTPLLSTIRGGVLVVSGVGDNRQEPQLINLIEAFAHTGLVVMNVTTPILMSYNISARDSDAVVQAFKRLANLPGVQGHRTGMLAFSAGVPLICFAAADPRIRADVAYLSAFGGYFDTRTLLRTFARRAIDIDGRTEPWQPIDIPVTVLTNLTTQYFSPDEQNILTAALTPGGQPLTTTQLAQLSRGARADYHLLKGDAPAQVTANMAALPPAVQQLLVDLSPSRVISQIRAPLFLLHDRNDHSLPVTETRAFDAALTRLHHQHEYVEFHIFDHVEIRSGLDFWQLTGDGTRLFNLLNDVLYANS